MSYLTCKNSLRFYASGQVSFWDQFVGRWLIKSSAHSNGESNLKTYRFSPLHESDIKYIWNTMVLPLYYIVFCAISTLSCSVFEMLLLSVWNFKRKCLHLLRRMKRLYCPRTNCRFSSLNVPCFYLFRFHREGVCWRFFNKILWTTKIKRLIHHTSPVEKNKQVFFR